MIYPDLQEFSGKKVLITGNTGFKGSWATLFLKELGAEVIGYSLDPPTNPAIYDQLNIKDEVIQYTKDVRSLQDLKACLSTERPDVVFHLAAQPLVRESYDIPLETMEVNVMGTVNLMEAIRQLRLSTCVVLITTDKCYENREWLYGYREVDKLGGYDPYSASKGAAEIAISSYRRSFFNPDEIHKHGVRMASARAGNVIGGGDWAADRIVPDIIRSLEKKERIFVRNPNATRPWQHVLEPISGYLLLAANLLKGQSDTKLNDAFNFGPMIDSNKPVEILTEEIIQVWGEGAWFTEKQDAHHEASLLNLTIDKAYHLLNWLPRWNFKETISKTVEWYKTALNSPEALKKTTISQINEYLSQ
jgi:CDP-glucose 4,6-dehydratase